MGLDYCFESIVRRDSIGQFAAALASHLTPDDGNLLIDALRRDPERLMELAKLPDFEKYSQLCLTFLFEPDESIDDYEANYRLSDPVTGRVAVGCVWTSFYLGGRFVRSRFTAATSAMSIVFERSSNVRKGGVSSNGTENRRNGFRAVYLLDGRLA